MKKLLLLFGLSLFIFQSNAQELKPIEIGQYYTQDGVRLRVKTIKKIVKPSLVATQEVKRGRSLRTWSMVLAGLSGAAIGSSAAAAGADETTQTTDGWNPTPGQGIAIGVGGVIVSTIVYVIGGKHILKGVEAYNSYVETNSSTSNVSLELGLAKHGVGLTITF